MSAVSVREEAIAQTRARERREGLIAECPDCTPKRLAEVTGHEPLRLPKVTRVLIGRSRCGEFPLYRCGCTGCKRTWRQIVTG